VSQASKIGGRLATAIPTIAIPTKTKSTTSKRTVVELHEGELPWQASV
jgi:hypothetical protein